MNARDQLLVTELSSMYAKAQSELGITNKDVAKHLKVSEQFYGRIVKGEIHLPVPKMNKLFKFLGISKSEYKKCLNDFVNCEVNRVFK